MADYIASVSGGKDSAAMCLYLQEKGIEHRRVFFDTGWEHPALYQYLKHELPDAIGPIEWIVPKTPELAPDRELLAAKYESMLGHHSAMIRWIFHKGLFPSRLRRWCTEKLKINSLKSYLKDNDLDLPVSVVGVRASESKTRSKLPERELSTSLDCMVWRPLLRWSKQDVIDIHTRHQLKPCSLYLNGHDRVGCWPCIFSRKTEVRLVADSDDQRINILRELENDVQALAAQRIQDIIDAGETIKNPNLEPPTFFGDKANKRMASIDEMVEWSKTSRGGSQTVLFSDNQLEPSCMSWGLCDTGDAVTS